MAVSFQGLFYPMTLRSVDGTTIVDPMLYYAIGDPLERPARILKWDNLTDAAVFISMNGVEDFTVIPAGGFLLLDVNANKTVNTEYLVNEGAQFYAASDTTPTSGSVYLTAIGSRDM